MRKVITYGTFDCLHHGHIRLLERAKKLGDYLIVGVTSDGYDITRGKINNHDTLMQRLEAVKNTGLADEIIVEEYEGQKIDDIKKYGVDIFTVGDDWQGKFDYLCDYCEIVYLKRTEGISSTEIRSGERKLAVKLEGIDALKNKFENESSFVNGITINNEDYDAIYLFNSPKYHYKRIKEELEKGKHILCESPIVYSSKEFAELKDLAAKKNLILMESLKTAYSVAYNRLLVLIKSGKIGKIVSVEATCTSFREFKEGDTKWGAMTAWGSTALLPIFQILGTNYDSMEITTQLIGEQPLTDGFTKIDFRYPNAVASMKVANSAKSEGELVISGTKGYIYVPAPWWKTDYFEARFEAQEDTKKYFYQLDGEGIRNELVAFAKSVENHQFITNISDEVSLAIVKVYEKFHSGDFHQIK